MAIGACRLEWPRGRFALSFKTSVRKLLTIQGKGDENVARDCDAYSRGGGGRYLREIDAVWNVFETV